MTPILISLHLLPIKFRIQFKVLVITFRALHGQAPAYIRDLLQPHTASRSVTSPDQGLLVVPRSRLKTKGDCAFEVVAPKLWNSLPLDLKSVDTVDTLKKQLKTHLFRRGFVWFYFYFLLLFLIFICAISISILCCFVSVCMPVA